MPKTNKLNRRMTVNHREKVKILFIFLKRKTKKNFFLGMPPERKEVQRKDRSVSYEKKE
jgi:hypothetical protein